MTLYKFHLSESSSLNCVVLTVVYDDVQDGNRLYYKIMGNNGLTGPFDYL